MENRRVGLSPPAPERGPAQKLVAGLVAGIGKSVSWLLFVMVVVIFSIVVLRYGLNVGWIWLQEAVVYMHSAVFLLAVAWAFQADEHVRVDIFYRDKSPRYKAWVNLLGTLLLVVPFSIYFLWVGLHYVSTSWAVLEGSREAGGLDFVYLLKSLLLLLPALLLLQAFDTVMRCLAELRSRPAVVTP